MRKFGIGLAAVLAIAAMGSAQAVHLDSGGRGQVLLYPYYTVNNGQQTLVSVTNTSSVAQAAKVRFNEGYNGRPVFDFNLFLSPFDSWTATVFALRDAGVDSDGAAVLTRDTSCIAPLFSEDNTSIDGTPYVAFREFAYLTPDDGGPYTIDRTREGSIEIIAMANVGAPLASAIAHGSNGSPPTGCAEVRNLALGDTGVQSAPSGGLMGSVSIINGGQGTYLSARAEALAGFTGVGLFTPPGSIFPNFERVNDGAGAVLGSQATAHVFDANGKAQDLTYPGADPRSRRIDAVSAVLMADRIYNEYQISTALAAASDWVVTMPTKAFYVNEPYINANNFSAIPPFRRVYSGSSTQIPRFSAVSFDPRFYTRDGQSGPNCPTFTPLTCRNPAFGYVTNAFPISKTSLSSASLVLGSRLINLRLSDFYPNPQQLASYPYQFPILEAGSIVIGLNPADETHALLPSAEGKILRGLPVIGFWASNIVNANAIDGVLANYAAAVRHATSVSCVKESDGTPCD